MKPLIRVLVLVLGLGVVLVLCSGCANRVYKPFIPVGYYPKTVLSG